MFPSCDICLTLLAFRNGDVITSFVFMMNEEQIYDGVTNHQVVATLCGRLGVFGLLG